VVAEMIDVSAGDGRRLRVRLEGANRPERRQPFSDVARNFVSPLAARLVTRSRVVPSSSHEEELMDHALIQFRQAADP
jgi:hypothetical protein